MTTQIPSQNSLYAAIEHCLLKDQFPLRRSVQQWQRLPDGQAKDELLAKIVKRIENSQAVCQLRQQPVNLKIGRAHV